MSNVRPKKHLGQHFLADKTIAQRIAQSLTGHSEYEHILEIGPGTGALTQFLLERNETIHVIDIDTESIAYLKEHFTPLKDRIIEGDFLKEDLRSMPSPYAIAGNFPYNISSQILFRVLELKEDVPEVVGMFQKEVAKRIASGPGSKEYGILSVLLQAYYKIEYLFTVKPGSFVPPPKVDSGVIRLTRYRTSIPDIDEKKFKQVVKMAFNQRRKTMRNSLKSILPEDKQDHEILSRRPEELGVEGFVELVGLVVAS